MCLNKPTQNEEVSPQIVPEILTRRRTAFDPPTRDTTTPRRMPVAMDWTLHAFRHHRSNMKFLLERAQKASEGALSSILDGNLPQAFKDSVRTLQDEEQLENLFRQYGDLMKQFRDSKIPEILLVKAYQSACGAARDLGRHMSESGFAIDRRNEDELELDAALQIKYFK